MVYVYFKKEDTHKFWFSPRIIQRIVELIAGKFYRPELIQWN